MPRDRARETQERSIDRRLEKETETERGDIQGERHLTTGGDRDRATWRQRETRRKQEETDEAYRNHLPLEHGNATSPGSVVGHVPP